MRGLEQKIEALRAMAHPTRVAIIEELSKGVKCVGDFEEFLELSQPNVSQHLGLLRTMGIVGFYMEGRSRCYFLKDPIALDLLALLKKRHDKLIKPPACCPVKKPKRRAG